MRFLTIGLLAWLLTGCLKNTDIVDPNRLIADRTSSLYVVCFIAPQDTILSARVALSQPTTSTLPSPSLLVKTATVTISDDQQRCTLPYDSTVGYYRARPAGKLSIRAGQTYRLAVILDENRRVTAQATVPASIPIERFQIDSVRAPDQSLRYTTTIFWSSPGGINYYRGYGLVTQLIGETPPLDTRISQPSFFVDRENSTGPNSRSLTGTHTLVVPANSRVRTRRVRLGLFTTDQNYYRYHSTLRDQINSFALSFSASTVLFSDIDGGYGVFAAYNASYIDMDYPIKERSFIR